MRFSWFLAVFSVIGAALLLSGVSAVEVVDNNSIDFTSDTASSSRKLKDMIGRDNYGGGKMKEESAELDDYRPVDPSPSSEVIRPKPIEHGAPLMPFLPNPSPPPQNGP